MYKGPLLLKWTGPLNPMVPLQPMLDVFYMFRQENGHGPKKHEVSQTPACLISVGLFPGRTL
jgi:hypothetical protein